MAQVKTFKVVSKVIKPQPSAVECGYACDRPNGLATLLQLETYGSETRKATGVVSQSLQFDRKVAHELWMILGQAFDFKSA